MSKWKSALRADPTDWLLEPNNPSVRYWTLVDILDRPADDREVLAAQKQDGYWVQRDYYLPKAYGTFWVLSVLADLGLTAKPGLVAGDERVRQGCEFMFTFQHRNGAFGRRCRVAGQGIVWRAKDAPCTHARTVRFLIQFGYADDPRVRKALERLLATQRDDGMWLCDRRGRGCLRATLDVLRAAVLAPQVAAQPAISRAAAIVCDLLMEPKMGHYHVDDQWTVLEYPYFGYGVIPALDALAWLGYALERPKIAAAMEYLLSRQLPDGTWPLDRSPRFPPLDFGAPGGPNKWLTLDALRVIKQMGE